MFGNKISLTLSLCGSQGIGSRLMAKMGYIVGSGLGPSGEGRVEPVEAVVFPPGKSLGMFFSKIFSSGTFISNRSNEISELCVCEQIIA